jgi:hypothetical protein
MTDAELWCEGLRFCGRRQLQENEIQVLDARIARARTRMAWADRCMAAGVLLMFILSLYEFVSSRGPGVDNTTETLAALDIFVLGIGCIGSLLEVIFAPKVSTRLLFAAALLIAIVRMVFIGEGTLSPMLEDLIALPVMFIILGGSAMMVLRWRDRRRLRAILERASTDCRGGEVMRFGFDAADGKQGIEMLPASQLACEANSSAVGWKVVYVTSVSKTPHSLEAPVIGYTGEQVRSGGLVYNQRHMSSQEMLELRQIRRRSIRKGIGSTVAITYVCGLIFTSFGDKPTIIRVLTSLLFGGMYLQKQWQVWRNLRIDLAGGMILVVRPKDEAESSPSLAEVLPASHLEWTTNGNPSRWRVARW